MRQTRRSRAVAVACVVALLASFPAAASADRDYLSVFSENHQGDITGTGNTLLSCFDTDARCAAARNGTASGGNLNNNGLPMDWVDVDGDPTTFNSSAATLVLPSGARIVTARLYYTGRLDRGADDGQFKSRPAPDPGARDHVLFRPPNLGDYVTLTAQTVDDAIDETNNTAREYQGIVDVTDLVRAAGAGEYTVANVQLGTGKNNDQAGGWALAVVYEDTNQPMRNLTIFDGFRFVLADGPPVDIPLSGFTTPRSGPVTTNLGLVAVEGDLGTRGDSATINADTPQAAEIANATNPADNFFNASISDRSGRTFTLRRPDYLNQMGFDADIVNATGRLQNNQTSTTLRLATSGDGFAPNGVSFATDLFAPSLRVEKTVTPATYAQSGDVLTYTVGVTNTGQDAATNTVLTDKIPDGTTYVPGSLEVLAGANAGPKTDPATDDQAEFDEAAKAVVFRLGNGAGTTLGGRLEINESTQIRFNVRVKSDGLPSGFEVVNEAGIGFVSDTLGEPGEVNSPDVVTPVRIPDVTIKKSHTGPIQSGRRTPFRLVVSNIGDAATHGPVTVIDQLPDELSFTTKPSGDGWDCSATSERRLSCVRSDALAPGGFFPAIEFVARVAGNTQEGDFRNTARVDASPDGNPSNNKDTDVGPVTRPLVDLAIAKTAVTRRAFPGDTVEFTLQITNMGPDVATGVRVRDVVPPGLTEVSLAPSRGTCTGTVCRLGRMGPDARATIDVKAIAGPDTGGRRLRDVARVSAREDELALKNNVDRASVRIIPLADLAVTKTTATPTLPAGNDVSFAVVVENNGPSSATQVRLTDLLPAPLQLVSATPLQGTCTGLTCDLGSLAAGAATQIVVIAHSDPSLSGRTLTNIAVADAREHDRDLGNNAATSDVTFTAPAVQPGDIVVTKTASPERVNVGGELSYRVTATNRGPGTADSVIVTDTPDPGLLIVSVTPSQGTCTAGTPIVCQLGPLGPGTSASVVIRARAMAPGPLRNGVTAIPATTDGDHSATATATSRRPPRVTLRKRATRKTVHAGDELTFVLTATARGVGTARRVRVCDRLPAGLSALNPGRARVGNRLRCWTIARLRAGQSQSLRLRVRVSASAARGRMTNVASLTSANQPPRRARARIRVLAPPPPPVTG